MTVDRKAIDEMAKLMRLLNGEAAPVTESQAAPLTQSTTNDSVDPGVAAMKDILLKLREAGNPTMERLKESANHDEELKDAMQTTRTSRGAQVGSWEIVVNEGTPRKYDVCNVATGEPIAKDLYLYEAAYALVKRLNQGIAINDARVRDLLFLEEEYTKNRNDAAVFRRQTKKLTEAGQNTKAAIAEDRYDEAKRKALDAKDRIMSLAGLRRR